MIHNNATYGVQGWHTLATIHFLHFDTLGLEGDEKKTIYLWCLGLNLGSMEIDKFPAGICTLIFFFSSLFKADG